MLTAFYRLKEWTPFLLAHLTFLHSWACLVTPRSSEFKEPSYRVLASGRRHGLPGGLWKGAAHPLEQRIDEGWQFISLGMDIELLMGGGEAALRAAKRLPEVMGRVQE